MPYAPGISYRGDQYLYQGLSALGTDIASGIKNLQDQQKIESYNDLLVKHAYESGSITPEDVAKYNGMSASGKTGFAAGLAANVVDDYKKQEMALRNQQIQSLIDERTFQPTAEQQAAAQAAGKVLLPTGSGRYTPADYPDTATGAAEPVVKPFLHPITGEPVPGLGIATMPGSKAFQVVSIPSGGGMQIEIDAKTGIPFYRDAKGNPRPLTGQQMMAGQMNKPTPTPTPTPGLVDWIRSKFGGAQPTPAPTPATTPIPQQQDTGATPVPEQPTQTSDKPGMYYDANGNLRSVDTVPSTGIPAAAPKVHVKAPNGQPGWIPATQLQAALAQGYQQLQ